MDDSGERLITTGTAARQLGVSANTIKRWAALGHLRIVHLPSGHHRIPAGEVQRLRESGPTAMGLRRAGFEAQARLQRDSPAERPSLDELLAWVDVMTAMARAQPNPPQPDPDATATQLRRTQLMLRNVRA